MSEIIIKVPRSLWAIYINAELCSATKKIIKNISKSIEHFKKTHPRYFNENIIPICQKFVKIDSKWEEGFDCS